jgi:AcrR family transcriptional regulator
MASHGKPRQQMTPAIPDTDLPTRERILQVAQRLFAAHGFAGLALRRIATEAQVPLGSIAYHFGSKEGLYRAIWEKWMGKAQASRFLDQAGLDEALTPEDGLRRVVDAFFAGPRLIMQENEGQSFITIMVREAHDPHQSSRGLIESFVIPNSRAIHAALAQIMPDLSEEHFAVGFQMTVSALRVIIEQDLLPAPLRERAPQDMERLFSIITDYVVSGWLGLLAARDRLG